jgi:hypothetical protein
MILHTRVRGVLYILILALVAQGRAEKESAPPNAAAPQPIPAGNPGTSSANDTGNRPPDARPKLSHKLARQVSSALPAWTPPPQKPAENPPPPDPGLVRMKPFIVTEKREKLSESDVLTDTARLKIAENKYTSPLYRVTFGPLGQIAGYYFNFLTILQGWHPNEAESIVLYRQDERLGKLQDLDDLARIESIGGDAKDAKDFRRLRFEASASSR